MSKPTKAQVVAALNVLLPEDEQVTAKSFKSVKAANEALGQAIVDNVNDNAVIPSDVQEVATAAGIEMPKAKTKRKRGSHCHTRVFEQMLKAKDPQSKAELAEAAGTTQAVVANAFYDIRRGNRLPSKYDGQKFPIVKSRDPERGVLYALGEAEPIEGDLFD